MSFDDEVNLYGKTSGDPCGGELVSSLGTGKTALDLRKGSRRCSKATTMGYSADDEDDDAGNARIEEWASPFALAKQRIFIEG
jgi:hypothetical protein